MKIIEYDIIASQIPSMFIDTVNNWIDKGWQPLGAPYWNPAFERMQQAIVKYEADDDE